MVLEDRTSQQKGEQSEMCRTNTKVVTDRIRPYIFMPYLTHHNDFAGSTA